jgi:hypothetical protein
MEGRSALIAAVVSAGLAVAIVAVDLQFGTEVELQALEDGEWVIVDDGRGYGAETPFGPGCAGQDLRLVIHNGGLREITVFAQVSYNGVFGSGIAIEEKVTLARGETREMPFRIPDSVWDEDPSDNSTEIVRPTDNNVWVSANVGEIYLSACVSQDKEASE